MLRFISLILFLGGLAAVAFGGWNYLQTTSDKGLGQADSEPMVVSGSRTVELPPTMPPGMAESLVGTESAQGAARGLIDQLQEVPIAYEAPSDARMGEKLDITLAVDATGAASAIDALPGRGTITEDSARVSDRIMARLTGSGFEIEMTSPETQTLSPLETNTWRWEVSAQKAGDQDLTLEIFALIEGEALPVRTFRDTVTVEVSAVQQVIQLAASANPLFVILGGLGSLIAGFAGLARLFKGV